MNFQVHFIMMRHIFYHDNAYVRVSMVYYLYLELELQVFYDF